MPESEYDLEEYEQYMNYDMEMYGLPCRDTSDEVIQFIDTESPVLTILTADQGMKSPIPHDRIWQF